MYLGVVTSAAKCVKTFYSCAIPTKADEMTPWTWCHGPYLIVAHDRGLTLISKKANGEWEDKIKLGGAQGHTNAITSISSNLLDGHLLLGSTGQDQNIVIWDLIGLEIMSKIHVKGAFDMTSFLLLPNNSKPSGISLDILIADNGGQLFFVKKVLDSPRWLNFQGQRKKENVTQESTTTYLDELFEDRSQLALPNQLDEVSQIEQRDDNKREDKVKRRKIEEAINFESDLESNGDEKDLAGEDLFGSDDDLEALAEKSGKIRKNRAMNKIAASLSEGQRSFQPGSTYLHDSNEKRSYLCLNRVGSIIRRQDNTSGVMIDVQYHDKSKARPLHLPDYQGWTLGSLGDKGVAFACPSKNKEILGTVKHGDSNSEMSPSMLQYIPFHSWAAKSDWIFALTSTDSEDITEDIIALAVGSEFIAIGTSHQNLRILSDSGRQLNVIAMGGPIVTSVAKGRYLAVVTHIQMSVSIQGKQTMTLTLFDLSKGIVNVLFEGPIPLYSKGRPLDWISFSESDQLVFMTGASQFYLLSTGNLSIGSRYYWMPYCLQADSVGLLRSSSQLIRHTLWPIALTADLALITTIVKVPVNSDRFEDKFPACHNAFPVMHQIELLPKLIESPLEAKYLHLRTNSSLTEQDSSHIALDSILDHSTALALDKCLFEILKGALDMERPMRAFDIYKDFSLDKSRSLALRLAQLSKLGNNLVERMQTYVVDEKVYTSEVRSHDEGVCLTGPPKPTAREYLKEKKREREIHNTKEMQVQLVEEKKMQLDEPQIPLIDEQDYLKVFTEESPCIENLPRDVPVLFVDSNNYGARPNPFAKPISSSAKMMMNPLDKLASSCMTNTTLKELNSDMAGQKKVTSIPLRKKTTTLGTYFKKKNDATTDDTRIESALPTCKELDSITETGDPKELTSEGSLVVPADDPDDFELNF